MQHINLITRRGFLDRSLKMGTLAALSTLVDLPMVVKRALAEGSIGTNGKKLLFIWLRGANDSLNSLVPIEDPSYLPYRPVAAGNVPNIGIPKDPQMGANYYSTVRPQCDFPIAGAAATYDSYPYAISTGNGFAALHPSLKFLAPVFNAGDLALVHRVGYPRQSRSHFDSQNYWENGSPNNNLIKNGILYRAMVESGLANTSPLTGVSIQSSLPLILRGDEAAMTNLTDPNRYALLGLPNNTNGVSKATAALGAAAGYTFAHKRNRDLLKLQYGNLNNTLAIFDAIDFNESGNTFQDDVKTDGDTNWVPINSAGQSIGDASKGYFLFPTNSDKNGGWRRPDASAAANKYAVPTSLHTFFNNLKAAALVLNKTDAIVAGTEFGGFDTHSLQGGVTGSHANLNRGIGWAMYALHKYFTLYSDKATWDNMVVITLSEFGRTTIQNSDYGTDHAEAGVMWVAGGGVNGGVYNCGTTGNQPWVPGAGGQTGSMFGVNGRYLKRNTDYRSVMGEIIRDHLGATQPQLNRIIPGYAAANEFLQSGGTSFDGTPIVGELGIV